MSYESFKREALKDQATAKEYQRLNMIQQAYLAEQIMKEMTQSIFEEYPDAVIVHDEIITQF